MIIIFLGSPFVAYWRFSSSSKRKKSLTITRVTVLPGEPSQGSEGKVPWELLTTNDEKINFIFELLNLDEFVIPRNSDKDSTIDILNPAILLYIEKTGMSRDEIIDKILFELGPLVTEFEKTLSESDKCRNFWRGDPYFINAYDEMELLEKRVIPEREIRVKTYTRKVRKLKKNISSTSSLTKLDTVEAEEKEVLQTLLKKAEFDLTQLQLNLATSKKSLEEYNTLLNWADQTIITDVVVGKNLTEQYEFAYDLGYLLSMEKTKA